MGNYSRCCIRDIACVLEVRKVAGSPDKSRIVLVECRLEIEFRVLKNTMVQEWICSQEQQVVKDGVNEGQELNRDELVTRASRHHSLKRNHCNAIHSARQEQSYTNLPAMVMYVFAGPVSVAC